MSSGSGVPSLNSGCSPLNSANSPIESYTKSYGSEVQSLDNDFSFAESYLSAGSSISSLDRDLSFLEHNFSSPKSDVLSSGNGVLSLDSYFSALESDGVSSLQNDVLIAEGSQHSIHHSPDTMESKAATPLPQESMDAAAASENPTPGNHGLFGTAPYPILAGLLKAHEVELAWKSSVLCMLQDLLCLDSIEDVIDPDSVNVHHIIDNINKDEVVSGIGDEFMPDHVLEAMKTLEMMDYEFRNAEHERKVFHIVTSYFKGLGEPLITMPQVLLNIMKHHPSGRSASTGTSPTLTFRYEPTDSAHAFGPGYRPKPPTEPATLTVTKHTEVHAANGEDRMCPALAVCLLILPPPTRHRLLRLLAFIDKIKKNDYQMDFLEVKVIYSTLCNVIHPSYQGRDDEMSNLVIFMVNHVQSLLSPPEDIRAAAERLMAEMRMNK